MKRVVKGIHYSQIDVDTDENDCVQISQNGRDEFNLIIFDKENSKKVALLIHPDLEQEKEEFAVGFSEWTNDLGKCDYYPSYEDVLNDNPVFKIWINRHNETDKKSTSELIELYKKVSHENN